MEHAALRLMPSDPAYPLMDWLQMLLCGPHNWNAWNAELQMETWYLATLIEQVEKLQGAWMDEVNWKRITSYATQGEGTGE